MQTSIIKSIDEIEQDVRMLRNLKEELSLGFKENDLDRLDFKIQFLEEKLEEKKKILKKLEWFFDTYIVKIREQIRRKKICVSRNKDILEKHPEVLYKLLQDIHKKEQKFGNALLQLKSTLIIR